MRERERKKGGARGALTMGFNPAGGEVDRSVRWALAPNASTAGPRWKRQGAVKRLGLARVCGSVTGSTR